MIIEPPIMFVFKDEVDIVEDIHIKQVNNRAVYKSEEFLRRNPILKTYRPLTLWERIILYFARNE